MAMVKFFCQVCGQKIQVPEAHVGRRVKCTGCGQVLVVPGGPAMTGAAQSHQHGHGHAHGHGHSHPAHSHAKPTQRRGAAAAQPSLRPNVPPLPPTAALAAAVVAQHQPAPPGAAQAPTPFRRPRRRKSNTAVVITGVTFLFLAFIGFTIFLAVKYGSDTGSAAPGQAGAGGEQAPAAGGPRKIPSLMPQKHDDGGETEPGEAPAAPIDGAVSTPTGDGGYVTIAGQVFKTTGNEQGAPANPTPPPGSGISTFYDPSVQRSVTHTTQSRLTVNKGTGDRAIQLMAVYPGKELAFATHMDVRLAIVTAGAEWQTLPGGADMKLTIMIDGREQEFPYESKEAAGDLAGQTAQRVIYKIDPASWLENIADGSTVRFKIYDDEYDLSPDQRKAVKQFYSYIQLGQ